jgi:arylsulfatase A-like enzyme
VNDPKYPPSARPPIAWILVAHVLGGAAIGAFDVARLGSASLALVIVPLFAATGLVAGTLIAVAERVVIGRPALLAVLVLALPSLVVTIPVGGTLFDGAYAQTLPLASALPVLVPIVLWLVLAAVVALVRWFARSGDLSTRGVVILGGAGAIGGIVWIERHVLRTGYPTAHIGATLALIVLAGITIRAGRRASVPRTLAAAIAGLALGTAVASAGYGLRSATERRVIATYADQARDLVQLYRWLIDLDRDGSSPVLGGGDCDDRDAARHPGAADLVGDGIDQDCDGVDAVPPSPPPPPPKSVDLETWQASPAVRAVLERTTGMNVLLVTVDALRFDVLAPDARDRADFPRITKLLDEAVWFTHAFSPASGTDVSLSTLLTGRFDPYQRVTATLPEALRGLGRRTYSALPVEVTRYVGDVLVARGIDRAKPIYNGWRNDDIGDHVSAGATTLEGIRALDDAGPRPSFVWVHYFDVHEHHQIDVSKAMLSTVHPSARPALTKYRALLAAIDGELGRLLDELERRHQLDKTIIIFASDHGESLGEDPRLLETHGKVTYGTLIRIPLAIRIPGVHGGQRTDPASLVDLAPTLLSLLGAPAAIQPLDGHDLVPALLDAPAALRLPRRALVVHEELQWSVVDWPYHLLVRPADNLVELYDVEHDPTEHDDLTTKLPDVVARLRARYAEQPVVKIDRTPEGRSWRERQAARH